ncbi:MAG: hypothetical protein WDW38_005488 [Sanguina aurantia]
MSGGGGGGGRGGGKRSGGSGSDADKHAKKSKYAQQKNTGAGSQQAMPIGSRGILVTCNSGWEPRATGEAMALIEEHFDKLRDRSPSGAATASKPAAPQQPQLAPSSSEPAAESAAAKPEPAEAGPPKPSASRDIAALLAAEVAGLKDKTLQRFKLHQTGIKGTIYIMFMGEPAFPGPEAVVTSLLTEGRDTKVLRARHCSRFFPISHVCYGAPDEMKLEAVKVIEGHFPAGEGVTPVTFAVEYDHRAAGAKLERLDVISMFTDHIRPPHGVNLTLPTKTILVQLIRNTCGMSVVHQYRELARYNVKIVSDVEEEKVAKAMSEAALKGREKDPTGAAAAAAPTKPEGADAVAAPAEEDSTEAAAASTEAKTETLAAVVDAISGSLVVEASAVVSEAAVVQDMADEPKFPFEPYHTLTGGEIVTRWLNTTSEFHLELPSPGVRLRGATA